MVLVLLLLLLSVEERRRKMMDVVSRSRWRRKEEVRQRPIPLGIGSPLVPRRAPARLSRKISLQVTMR